MYKVAVIYGGNSSEAAVSRESCATITGALIAGGCTVNTFDLVSSTLAQDLNAFTPDVVFPLTHGQFGEDGCLQGMLEILGFPYVGSGVLSSALAMHKDYAKKLFIYNGLPVAKGIVLHKSTELAVAINMCREKVGAKIVVKPNSSGSAVGVHRFSNAWQDAELSAALQDVWSIDDYAVIEEFISGVELSCGVLDLHGSAAPQAFSPTEICAVADEFYSFAAKYKTGGSVHHCPARVSNAVTKRVQELSLQAHTALGCRDYSRSDFMVADINDPDTIVILETNTLPGMTATSLYPEQAGVAGIDLTTLSLSFVRSACDRGATKLNTPVVLPV